MTISGVGSLNSVPSPDPSGRRPDPVDSTGTSPDEPAAIDETNRLAVAKRIVAAEEEKLRDEATIQKVKENLQTAPMLDGQMEKFCNIVASPANWTYRSQPTATFRNS